MMYFVPAGVAPLKRVCDLKILISLLLVLCLEGRAIKRGIDGYFMYCARVKSVPNKMLAKVLQESSNL